MKKILITGASGFLGGKLAASLQDSGAAQVLTPSHHDLELTSAEAVLAYMEQHKPDAVVHCAAVSDVGTCEKNPRASYPVNVEAPTYLAKASAKLGCKCILCSSDQVYVGSTMKEPHMETEHLSPGNHYGRQKLEMEQRCLQVNPDVIALRLSWMYDAHQKPGMEHHDFTWQLLKDLREKTELYYPVYDIRGITDVTEVVHGIRQILGIEDKDAAEKRGAGMPAISVPGGVYNFGAQNGRSTYEVMREAFRRAGLPLEMVRENTEAFLAAPRNLGMNTEKIRNCGIVFSGMEQAIGRVLQDARLQENR